MTSETTAPSPDPSLDSLVSADGVIPFEAFEVQGAICRRGRCIKVPDSQAEYWTIIAYMSGKEVCGIGRFTSRPEAVNVSRRLVGHERSE
jgi:hypothetical protein